MHQAAANQKLAVLGWPAFRNRTFNPYNASLYDRLVEQGVVVEESSPRKVMFGRYDVWHVHWPDLICSDKRLRVALFRSLGFIFLMGVARIRNLKIVWTVHNLKAHEATHVWLERLTKACFLRAISGFISLTRSAHAAVLERYPDLGQLESAIIAHGHYRGAYPDTVTRAQARERLGIAPDQFVFGFFGMVRPYKNVPGLIKAFRSLRHDDALLLIRGHVQGGYRGEVEAACGGDAAVRCELEFIETDAMQCYMRATDIAVLPYSEILNSGAALLALSFGVPIVVPAIGSLAELQDLVGEEWVFTYRGEISPAILSQARAWASARSPEARADLEKRLDEISWPAIAAKTRAFYASLVGTQTQCSDTGRRT